MTGTSTGDPSLTGDVTVTLRDFVEGETGGGFQRGTLVIRDPATGKKKAAASFVDSRIEEIWQGTLVGWGESRSAR